MKQADVDDVRFWVERLRAGTEAEKVRAASEMTRIRIRTRGAVSSTRGDLNRSAGNEFPSELRQRAMETILTELQSASPAIRREVAIAVGEWVDESAVSILAIMLSGPAKDSEVDVRRACVSALSQIGGTHSAKALRAAALTDESVTVRSESIDALAALAARSYPIKEEPESASARPADEVPRTGGSHSAEEERQRMIIRSRRATSKPRPDLSTEAAEVLRTLRQIASDANEPNYIRHLADKAADPLQKLG